MQQKVSPFRYILPVTFFVFFSFFLYTFLTVTVWQFPLIKNTKLTEFPRNSTESNQVSATPPDGDRTITPTPALTAESFSAFFNQTNVSSSTVTNTNPTSKPAQAFNISGREMQITLTEDQVQKVIDTFLPTVSKTIPIKSFTIDFEGDTFKADIDIELSFFKGAVSANGRVIDNKIVLDNGVVGIIPLSAANLEYVSNEINKAIYNAASSYQLKINSLALSNNKLMVVLSRQ